MSENSIYMIRCLPTQKVYVGSTTNSVNRWRNHRWGLRNGKGCNLHLQRAWDKYGESSFEFKVLRGGLPEDALRWWEAYYINMLGANDRRFGYNSRVEDGTGGFRMTEDAISRIRMKNTGQKRTPEARAKMGAAHRGAPRSPEAVEKSAAYHRGRKRGSETVERIRASRIGVHHMTEEGKKRIGAASRGRVQTPEAKAKQIAAQTGRVVSEGHRSKISAGNTGKVRTPAMREATRQRTLAYYAARRMEEANA